VQDLWWLTRLVFCFLLTVSRPLATAEIVTIATWNLNWFPGGNPTSSEAERLIHMSAACKEGEVAHERFGPVGAFGGCLMFES
jgi:hypothetical protein